MKIHDRLHGFTVTGKRELPEIGAILWEMTYEACGTPLLYLERPDTNKTFAIAFKTVPEDSTGVFHILEHSVLCGSDKYPVKEPFVDLLKGSMQTFLNAMTFNDKTVYPLSSRNDKDFLNLIDVYMDAVLHPAILKNRNIFLQEGWHYEMTDKDAAPTYKGVVFNEMKGAYSSADEVASEVMNALLYPDTCYGKDSGGDPVHIPELTYEHFLDCHRRFYHPSNARIFLDGAMDLDAVLAKLDGFLRGYEKQPALPPIAMQPPVPYTEKRMEYEIAEDDDPKGKVRVSFGYMGFRFDDQRDLLAMSLIAAVLAGSNEAPLKRALLAEGLCEDVTLSQNDGIAQTSVVIDVRNTEEEKIPRIREVIRQVLTDAAENGLSRERTVASLNSMEFRLRERDFGSTPRGLVYGLSALETWLYDGDPAQTLCYNEVLAFLRENLGTGYLEGLIRRVLLDNPHSACLIMVPSGTLAARRLAEEEARLAAARASWDDRQVQQILDMNRDLVAWQQGEDTPEAKATLPALSVSDISPLPERIPAEERKVGGVPVLYHDLATEGIAYVDLFFGISDIPAEDLPYLSLLAGVFTRLSTTEHDASDLQNLIKKDLGALTLIPEVYAVAEDVKKAKIYLHISASVLENNKNALPQILGEVLFHTVYNDRERVLNILRQMKSGQEESMGSAGHVVGIGRTSAYLTSAGAVSETLQGYDNYLWMKDTEKNFDARFTAVEEKLSVLCRRYFTRDRLFMACAGAYDPDWLASLAAVVPADGVQPPVYAEIPPLGVRREGLEIPAQIAFAVQGGIIPYTGAYAVAGNLISYEYLWNAIRVQGGAYGAGMLPRRTNQCFFYTYRDPSAARSLDVFGKVAAFLRDYVGAGGGIDKYIIGAVAASEPLLSPHAAASLSHVDYITGVTYEDRVRIRTEMLAADSVALSAVADGLESMIAAGAVFVTGGKDKLDTCTTLENILKM